jgi:hypothetical protein
MPNRIDNVKLPSGDERFEAVVKLENGIVVASYPKKDRTKAISTAYRLLREGSRLRQTRREEVLQTEFLPEPDAAVLGGQLPQPRPDDAVLGGQ